MLHQLNIIAEMQSLKTHSWLCMQIGLKLMRDDGRVFSCYTNMWDTIFYSELGSSLAILRGGYNLDSFMVRYQGVDWTNEANWECNSRSGGSHSFCA